MFRGQKYNKKRGFSFVELMIAVSIFGLLSTLSIASYTKFNNRIGVDTLAHQIAQFGREAQVSALSVKRGVFTGTSTFPGYGLHFEKASTTQFIFFADLDNDKIFDPAPGNQCGTQTSECEKVIKLLKGVSIKELCGSTSGGIEGSPDCVAPGPTMISHSFDIVFKRPNPDAVIKGQISAGSSKTDYSRAQIIISSTKGYKKAIEFFITGQVTVK